jgi:hypothetical protein
MNINEFFSDFDDCIDCYIMLHGHEHQIEKLKRENPNNDTYRVLMNWLNLSKIADTYVTPTILREEVGADNLSFEYNLIDEADDLDDEQKQQIKDFYEEHTGIARFAAAARAANAPIGGGKKRKQRKTRARKHKKHHKTRRNHK